MKKVLLLLHPGCEEIEAVTPIDLLRRAGIEVTTASVTSELQIKGGRGIVLVADALFSDCGDRVYDMLVVPGGPGVEELRKHAEVLDLIRKFHSEGRWIAAICAAPLVLLDAGILSEYSITSFPGAEEELHDRVRDYVPDRVYVDGKIVTSRGAGTSEEFSLALIRLLLDSETSDQVRQRIIGRS